MAIQSSPFSVMSPISAQTSPSTALTEEDLNKVQLGLDVAGMTPVVGTGADILNTVISLARGNKGEAAMSALASLPFIGQGFGGAKIATKGAKALDDIPKSAVKEPDIVFDQPDSIVGGLNKTYTKEPDVIFDQPIDPRISGLPTVRQSQLPVTKDPNLPVVKDPNQVTGVPSPRAKGEVELAARGDEIVTVGRPSEPRTKTALDELGELIKENPIKAGTVLTTAGGATAATTNEIMDFVNRNKQTAETGGDQVTPPVDTSVVAPQPEQPVIPEIPFEQRSDLEKEIIQRSQAGAPLIDPNMPEGFDPTGTKIEQPTMQEFLGAEQPAPERPKAPIEIMSEYLRTLPEEQRLDAAARYIGSYQQEARREEARKSAEIEEKARVEREAAEAKEAAEKKAERKRMRDAKKLARAKGFKGSAVGAEARRVIAEEDRQKAEQEARISEQEAQRKGVQERFDVSQTFREKAFEQDQKNLEDKIAREDKILQDEKASAEQKAKAQAEKDELTKEKLRRQIKQLDKLDDPSGAVDDAVDKADRLVDVGVFEDQSQGYLNYILNELGADPEDILGMPTTLDTLPITETPREPTDAEIVQFLAAAGGDENKVIELAKERGFLVD